MKNHFPENQGLYDPQFEHDSCGVGFVCNVKGIASNHIVCQGLEVLDRLSHRGAVGADPNTGDGAGILIQIPHQFFAKACDNADIKLPALGEYGTGLVFLPQDAQERKFCKQVFLKVVRKKGHTILGWREVKVDNSYIGETAKNSEPCIEQVFISRSKGIDEGLDFEKELYIIRKEIENTIRPLYLKQKPSFYITNLSSRTFSYKGLLMPAQIKNYFVDLQDKDVQSAICLVHSRYSTNTFPTWDLSQPFRFLAHNGEINTLRGNINWMSAREGLIEAGFIKKNKKVFPIITPGGSDSCSLDNVFELLVLAGRSLPHAMMMLIPPAWEGNKHIKGAAKDFYKYHASLIEPWDGPSAIAFTDGIQIGAVLDRNGLRPSRYLVTKNDLVVMASEAGVLDINPADIVSSGRLEPGKMFFIDTKTGKIITDEELKETVCSAKPYGVWLKQNMLEFGQLGADNIQASPHEGEWKSSFKAFGYTREDFNLIIKPMAEKANEPVGSMGNDTPLAVLSNKPQIMYNYFKQLFAQVTNPAIDPIREEVVMSLTSYLGPEKDLLQETPEHCHRFRVEMPVITDEDIEKIRHIKQNGFKTKTISTLFEAGKKNSLQNILDRICTDVYSAIEDGCSFIILSDRGVNKKYMAVPMLLSMGALHHYLVKNGCRTKISIILETGEAVQVHHFALLFGYGADLVNPYLAYEAVRHIVREGHLDINEDIAVKNYIKAVNKGILKILSKMGISTLQSYRGAQIFEALGLSKEVIDKCFCGTVSRIGGVDFETIYKETLLRHERAYLNGTFDNFELYNDGVYQWRKNGEFHLWNPDSISALQDAAWNNNYDRYKEFALLINNQSLNPATLRGVLKFKKTTPIPIEQVEPIEEIIKRFASGAMSFGSISKETHECIARAMNKLGGKSNTGEGGEDPGRFKLLANGDSVRSAIKQVASGRFGVTTNYLINADEIQIKIAQGAKPGEGGQLPGHKVSVDIARIRYTTPGVTLISPPPHHDIYSIEDLAQLIFDLKNVNPCARISVKLVSEIGVGTIAAGVAKGHADMILISGGDGGTGASPLSSIKHAGLPWELGLSEVHQTLILNDLRTRVRIQTDGQMRTGRDVAIAALLGAEEFGFCTAVLITLGCVMLRHCHLNNCSLGVATQDPALRKRFRGKPEYIINYFRFIAQELREIMAMLGIRTINEMIGKTELLELNKDILPWKAKDVDISKILYKPVNTNNEKVYCTISQNHGIDDVLDKKLIEFSEPALESCKNVNITLPVYNFNRSIGAMLSGKVCSYYGEKGLPNETIYCRFKGAAGQSFGAWLMKGITFELEGMANDYVGKGMSGGKIIIYPNKNSRYKSHENIIIGNTAFYGAITGEAYVSGIAGERFCIRNSGVYAVVEGIGDHGCEYMTGGRVVVLGRTGRNFGAGMSGGIAYIYDKDDAFRENCNMEMVELENLTEDDIAMIKGMISNHFRRTQSIIAKDVLDDFENTREKFIKVMPIEYKRVLAGQKELVLQENSEG